MITIPELDKSLQKRLQELRAEIDKLEEARARLMMNGAATKSTAARRRRPRPARTTRTKPKTEVLMAGKLEQMLGMADGLTTSAISQETDANRNQVRTLLRELETSGRVRRSGQRRGTRWHLITDEDRIAARAAELEKLSKRNNPSNRPTSAKTAKAVRQAA